MQVILYYSYTGYFLLGKLGQGCIETQCIISYIRM